MSREEGEEILVDAERAGAKYAHDQLEDNYFEDWVREQIAEADRMRRNDPSSVIEDPSQIARNMLQQLGWDTKRDLDTRSILELSGAAGVFNAGSRDWVRDKYGITSGDVDRSFYEGFDRVMKSPDTRHWLVDLITDTDAEIRGTPTTSGPLPRESRRKVRAAPIHRQRSTASYEAWTRDVVDFSLARGGARYEDISPSFWRSQYEGGLTPSQAVDAANDPRVGNESREARARRRPARTVRDQPQPVEDPTYIIQGLYNDGSTAGSFADFGFDDEETAIREAKKIAREPWFEGDFTRVITRDGELVWSSRSGRQRGVDPRTWTESRTRRPRRRHARG